VPAPAPAEPDSAANPPPPIIMKEFATGKRIDVTAHKNIQLLPTLQECGVPVKDETTKPISRIFSSKPNPIANIYPWMVRLINEGM
jgi:hypothetical protein